MATTYYVDGASGSDGNPGTTGSPWKTLNKAKSSINVGDTVKVRTATYAEVLNINIASTTWEADTGHTPTINGNYVPTYFTSAPGFKGSNGSNVTPGNLPAITSANIALGNWKISGAGNYSYIVQISANNVTFKGFVIRNVAGRGISVNNADNVVVEDCTIDFCYANNFQALDCNNLTVRNCTMTRGSAKLFDPGHDGALVDSCLYPKNCSNVLIDTVTMCYGWGEGINCGQGASNVTIQNCTAHTMFHTVYYSDGGSYGMVFRNNVGFWCQNLFGALGADSARHVFGLVDEEGIYNSTGVNPKIYNNILVGGYQNTFNIAGGPIGAPGPGTRGVYLNGAYVGFNTIVGSLQNGIGAGPYGDEVVSLGEPNEKKHTSVMVENNIWLKHPSNPRPLMQCDAYNNATFRNNLYNASIPAAAHGSSDVQLASLNTSVLANPFVEITGTFNKASASLPDVTTTFNAANYLPVGAGAGCVGAASSGTPAGGVTPPTQPRQYDHLDNARDAAPDIGALEYGGVGGVATVTAAFTRSPAASTITAGTTVQFTNTSTVANTTITSHLWTVALGGVTQHTATTQNLSYTFPTAGTWTVTLLENTAAAVSDSEVVTLTVTASGGVTVTAAFTLAPSNTTIIAGQSITFTNASTASNTTIASYLWTVKKAAVTQHTATTENLTYTFASDGAWTVTLQVTGATAITDDETVAITVTAAGTDSVTAAFTPSATTLAVGAAFTATNTSSASGYTISGYVWTVTDNAGASFTYTTTNLSHAFNAAGIWTVRLQANTVEGISDTEEASIIVQVAVSAGDSDFMVVPVTAALATSTGEQTVTAAALGTLVPKAVAVSVTYGTSVGTAANGEMRSEGAAAGGNQWVHVEAVDNAAAAANTARRHATDMLIMSINGSGAVTGEASWVEFVAGGVKINVTDAFPSGYQAIFTFYAGSDCQAAALTDTTSALIAGKAVNIGFPAKAVKTVSCWPTALDVADTGAELSIGWALSSGAQHSIRRRSKDNVDPMDVSNRYQAYAGMSSFGTPNSFALIQLGSFTATGFTHLVVSGTLERAVSFLAIGATYDAALSVAYLSTGASSDHAIAFQAQTVEVIASSTVDGTATAGDSAESAGYAVHSVNGSYSSTASVAEEDSAATSATRSLVATGMRLVESDSTDLYAGTAAIDADSIEFTWSTAPSAAYRVILLAWELGTSGGTTPAGYPVAAFVADSEVGNGEAVFYFDPSISNPNGGTISSWLWDFGDGFTSTEQYPTHFYQEEGTYDVSLTVANATGSDSVTQTALVTVTLDEPEDILVGFPFELDAAITAPRLPVVTAEEMEGIVADGNAVVPGYAVLYYRSDDDKIVILKPDGTTRTVTTA